MHTYFNAADTYLKHLSNILYICKELGKSHPSAKKKREEDDRLCSLEGRGEGGGGRAVGGDFTSI